MKITAIVPAKNEQDKIAGCLSALSFADEIIVVDNGSTDETVKIAEKSGARIVRFSGTDFAAMRNYAAAKASSTWLLYVDADEIVTRELAGEIKDAVRSKFSAFTVPRKNYFYSVSWPGRESFLRLVKKSALTGWQGSLHETALVDGDSGALKNPLLHNTHDDLAKMVAKTNDWSAVESRLLFEKGHPPLAPWRFFRVMATSFYRSYITQMGYRRKVPGIIEAVYQSFSTFITYAKLWEIQQKKAGF